MNLRKSALIALIASILSLVTPLWNALVRISGLGTLGSLWWILPSSTFILCLSAILPLFYFALARDAGSMRFPRYLRKLALVAALAGCIVAVLRLQVPGALSDWPSVISLLSNAAYLLLLLVISHEPGELPRPQVPPSTFLVRITRVAVVVWGAWVAFQFVRLAIVASTYGQLTQLAAQVGRAAPTRQEIMVDIILTFGSQAALLAAPFIVWRSGFGRNGME